MEFITGQHLLAVPELRRYVLTNLHDETSHLVLEQDLRNAFKDEYGRIMANRHPSWMVIEYFE